jgi:CheY-like chemotaxis protein
MDQENSAAGTATRPVVMLVEDNKILLKTYEQMFASVKELRAFRLAAFETAWGAMEWLNALEPGDAPAAIILDWVMEGMTGMDMLVALRKDPQLAAIPVIMATAKMGRLEVAEALARGANDYIVKPINTRILVQKLGRVAAPPAPAPPPDAPAPAQPA